MFNLDTQSFIKDFIFPAIVAILASLFSYFGSFKLNEKNRNEEKRISTIDLIDRMLLDLEKLNSILESLKEDAEKLRYFSLINTKIAKDLIGRFRGYFYSITLFKDDKLRKQIIEGVDIIDSLINDMDLIENHIVNERGKSESKRDELEKAFTEIKIRLLEQNYFIDVSDGSRAKKIGAKGNRVDKKSEVIRSILEDLVSSLKASQERVNFLDSEYEKKRSFMVVKILDAQTKLRELISELGDQKLELQK